MEIIKLTTTAEGYNIDVSAWEAYVTRTVDRLPDAVAAFVGAPWRYDIRDPRCLHDARLLQLQVEEVEGEEGRSNEVRLALAGAYGGRIELHYQQVTRLLLDKTSGPDDGFGDLLVEELVACGNGRFRHELAFVEGVLLLEFGRFSEIHADVPTMEAAHA